MASSLTIASPHGGARLIFADVAGESFSATLEHRAFTGRITASTFYSGPPSLLFDEMASEWRGWAGTKEWGALEGELHLVASSDRAGHISLRVIMRDDYGRLDADWRLQATVCLEAGQLDALARSVDRLFSPSTAH